MGIAKKNLFLPIEMKHREFFSQLFLSSYAIKAGFRVYIGSKSSIARLIKMKKSKGGIFFFKGGMEAKHIIDLKKKCDKFVVLDQEMGTEIKEYAKTIKRRIWPDTEKHIDRYYVIGKMGYQISKNTFPDMKDSIRCTGWPRVDIWRKENNFLFKSETQAISKKYGSYILFSSDFGFNSQKIIDERLEIIKKTKWKALFNTYEKSRENAYKVFKEYNKILEILKNYDRLNDCPQIIVRPHPAEDIDAWFEDTKKFSNVKVIYEGEITPWINASSGIIHRGCTSAMQGYLQDLPIAYYVTSKSDIVDGTPYDISEKLLTFDELIHFCKTSINKSKTVNSSKYSDNFKNMVHINNKKFASELIVEDLDELKINKELPCQSNIKIKIVDLLIDLRVKIKKYFKLKKKIGMAPKEIKMPNGISKEEVEDFLKLLDFSTNFKIREISKDCIEIEK